MVESKKGKFVLYRAILVSNVPVISEYRQKLTKKNTNSV